jgi:hypothetical protein
VHYNYQNRVPCRFKLTTRCRGISPNAGLPSKKLSDDIKPKVKIQVSKVQELMKETRGKGPETTHRYEIRSRKK